ncbi:MAG: nucleotidyltransferase domain-containing protein [Chloroflexi bacterium]|nr:nucleotidyltransferase domain-containing protein [Chloroflexota bacterium]
MRAHLPALRERYAVTSLGVFGSYVRGEQKKRSDLDVLVEFDRAPAKRCSLCAASVTMILVITKEKYSPRLSSQKQKPALDFEQSGRIQVFHLNAV